MIHKKRLIFLSLGCMTASASASYNPHLWGTFGAGIASSAGHVISYDNTSYPSLALAQPMGTSKKGFSSLSAAGLLQLGGGMNFNKFHVGAFFVLPGDTLRDSVLFQQAGANPAYQFKTMKAKFLAYGGGIRLGYTADKMLFFVNLGAISRRFKVTWDQQSQADGEQNIISEKKGMTAFVPGVGFEYLLTPCMALGMVANAQFYPSKTFESDGINRQSGLGSSIKFQPRNLRGLFTASYKFNL
ncbi:MAG: hypothetical protein K2P90_03100 [Holosporales bacterium]|nr:hypothetical protein [Holosporales bacterium]